MLSTTDVAELCELECKLLSPDGRNAASADRLLTDDFVEIGSSGRVWTRRDILAMLSEESPLRREASDFRVVAIADGAALVTYRVVRHDTPAIVTRRSSIWVRRDERWQMLFHQGTPNSECAP
jgi:hypothetical protein